MSDKPPDKPPNKSANADSPPPYSRLPRVFLYGLLLALILLLFFRPLLHEHTRQDGRLDPAVGKSLSSLELQPLVDAEQPVQLENVRGEVVLINYWGTWCPPCRIEFPHLVELHEDFREHEDFRFLSVSCLQTPGGDLEQLKRDTVAFRDQFDADFPIYADPEGTSRWALLQSIEQEHFAFPTTLILDRQGVIRGYWRGYAPGIEKEMRTLLEELLDTNHLSRRR